MFEDLKVKDLLDLMKLFKNENVEKKEDGRYVIVRSYSAGVFAGEIISKNGREVTLKNARRLWKWAGASCLSEIAIDGVKDPDNCKFPCEVDRIVILEAIEIIDTTEKCKQSIKKVKIWEM